MRKANAEILTRARDLLEAWLRGMNQGGHITTEQEIQEAWAAAMEAAETGR